MVKSSLFFEKQVELKKGPWTQEEDQKLVSFIQLHGAHGGWSSLPSKAGLRRCGKSCRLRWVNYLRPDIKRGNFSSHEDQTIIQLHALLGNKWSVIAQHLPKRTDNEIKNHWNTCLKKKLSKMGINPTTHKPFKDTFNLTHAAQWETARLEAEARQAKEHCKLNQLGSSSSKPSLTRLVLNKVTPRPPPPPCLDVLKVWHNSWSSSSSSTSTDPNTPKMHDMYAMMLAADDLESPALTLSFQDAVGGANGDGGDIMVEVEAFTSRGYNCNSVEGFHNEDVVLYNGGISDDFAEERQDWEAILKLANGFPSSPDFHM